MTQGTAYDIARIKADADMVSVAQAAGVELKRKHAEHVGRCPFHADKSPSFTVYKSGGEQKFKCFGCGEAGDVIDLVQKLHRVNTFEALKMLSGNDPARMKAAAVGVRGDDPVLARKKAEAEEDDRRRAERKRDVAKQLYLAGQAQHPALAAYFKGRGIDAHPGGLPVHLRFAAKCDYHCDETGEVTQHPAMLAPVYNMKREIIALHRTYLKIDASGERLVVTKADVPKAKKVLGGFAGGFIPLMTFKKTDTLNIAEGIETGLSVLDLHPEQRDGAFWTCIALDNLKNQPVPLSVDVLNIWADNDMADPTPDRPRDLRKQIQEVAAAFKKQKAGRTVRIFWPERGKDFNDVLKGNKAAGLVA